MSEVVVRLRPLQYVHIHDNNLSVTKLVCGPATYTLPQHESLVFKNPKNHISVPPAHYAIIENPVMRKGGAVEFDKRGQAKIQLKEREVRFTQDPFPLYPEEELIELKPLMVLTQLQSLVLHANRAFNTKDYVTGADVKRVAGEEYMFVGPGTYTPRVEEDVFERRDAIVVKPNESIKLRARNKFVDASGVEREVGDEYLYAKPGAYLPHVDEDFQCVVPCTVLTRQKAIHVEVQKQYTDVRPWAQCERQPGQVYLVTNAETAEFTPQPQERILREVPLLTLTNKQWAIILDPVENGVNQYGRRKVVHHTSLFLQPGERLEDKIKDSYVLAENEAILLSALEEFQDTSAQPAQKRVAGELWLVQGPCEYIPNSSVRVMKDKAGNEKRQRLVLRENEGVYVRNTLTGEVRVVSNCTYMLQATEELWEKDLPPVVEEKLARQGESISSYIEANGERGFKRDKTKLVSYLVPHNAVTQVYDYKKRSQRIIFGPQAVPLGPDEHFTVLSLSGSDWDPKRPNECLPKLPGRIKALYLFLGPASLADVLTVETLDHAQLVLQLSYDWRFDVTPGNETEAADCFRNPDFVGDCCSCIASRIRASIAGVSFDQFHKHSSSIVRTSVFGLDANKQLRKELRFPSNRLVVSSVDIQNIEVKDERTREALQQSVKMAIEITTQSQEAAARQEASVREQQAKGRLERQQIDDKASCEVDRKAVLEIETQSAAIETTGKAKAEAKARAEAAGIQGDNSVAIAKIKALTAGCMDQLMLEMKRKRQLLELEHFELKNALEIEFEKQKAETESSKFKRTMECVGKETVTALARAGPELQARLLKSLGLEGYLVTDGTNPINLFNTAKGLASQPKA